MQTLIVIPARVGSTRFPNKPLAQILGHSMVERVWKIAKSVNNHSRIVVATDDAKIISHVENFGGEAVLTPTECQTGSDRAAYVSKSLNDAFEIVLSFQGDAVLTPPWIVEKLIESMLEDSSIEIATPAIKLEGIQLADFLHSKSSGSSTGTCVVFGKKLNALYFSKSVLPRFRNLRDTKEIYRHIGTYAFRRETLYKFSSLPQSELEKAEGLEQLRALENEIPIKIVLSDYRGRTHASVDNPEDISIVEKIISEEGELVNW